MEEKVYKYLKSLKDSDFQIVEGEPNIIGWEVKSEAGTYIGEIKDLLFDPETNAVRYLIIDLEDNGMNLGDKKVMVPIGIAHLHTSDDEVVLPNVHIDQFNALPAYDEDATVPATEVQIREVIGSPAALRMEENIAEFDRNQFYAHHHFDRGKFYQRGGTKQDLGDRTEQQHTIHEIIDNSPFPNSNTPDGETNVEHRQNDGRSTDDPDYPGNNKTPFQ